MPRGALFIDAEVMLEYMRKTHEHDARQELKIFSIDVERDVEECSNMREFRTILVAYKSIHKLLIDSQIMLWASQNFSHENIHIHPQ